MKNITLYRIKQLGRKLKDGTAWIEGRTCDGDRWPEGDHYYICIDGMHTYHVPCDKRPAWAKYVTQRQQCGMNFADICALSLLGKSIPENQGG